MPDMTIVNTLCIKLLLIHLLHFLSATIISALQLSLFYSHWSCQEMKTFFSQNSALRFCEFNAQTQVKYFLQCKFTYQLKYGGYLISDLNLSPLADGKIVTIYWLEECIWELCLHITFSWYSGSMAQMITISLEHGIHLWM